MSTSAPAPNFAPPPSDSGDQYAMQDMHGHYVCHVSIDEARRLLKLDYAHAFGTKKKVHGIRLTVTLAKANGRPESPQRSSTAANYAGTRFVFKQMVDLRDGKVKIYRFKRRFHVTESPEHALRRILIPPALETSYYCRREDATDLERANDPAKERRRQAMTIFSLAGH